MITLECPSQYQLMVRVLQFQLVIYSDLRLRKLGDIVAGDDASSIGGSVETPTSCRKCQMTSRIILAQWIFFKEKSYGPNHPHHMDH